MKTCKTETTIVNFPNRLLSMLVVLTLILTFAGCGSNNTSSNSSAVEKTESQIKQLIVNEICKQEHVESISGFEMATKNHEGFNSWRISGTYCVKDKYGNVKDYKKYDAITHDKTLVNNEYIDKMYVSVNISYN